MEMAIKAVRWQMGVSVDDPVQAQRALQRYQALPGIKNDFGKGFEVVAQVLGRHFLFAQLARLGVPAEKALGKREDSESLESFCDATVAWLMQEQWCQLQMNNLVQRSFGFREPSGDVQREFWSRLRSPRQTVTPGSLYPGPHLHMARFLADTFKRSIELQLRFPAAAHEPTLFYQAYYRVFQAWVAQDSRHSLFLARAIKAAMRPSLHKHLNIPKKQDGLQQIKKKFGPALGINQRSRIVPASRVVTVPPNAPIQPAVPIPVAKQSGIANQPLAPTVERHEVLPVDSGEKSSMFGLPPASPASIDRRESGGDAEKQKVTDTPPAPGGTHDDAANLGDSAPPPRAVVEWRDLPIEDSTEPHDEFFATAVSNANMRIVGARARGKKHKHEGTNCDDWFTVTTGGNWTIMAVSDGAGSKRFSRIGSKASCEAATRFLSERLANLTIEIDQWTQDTFSRDADSSIYAHSDLAFVQTAIVEAMQSAHDAIEAEARQRAELEPYTAALGRPVEPADLSCTLLLAVHTMVKSNGSDRSFGMACQIGDGMSALVIEGGRLQLLGMADSGQFSGETEFITSKKALVPEVLRPKVIPYLAPLKALMVMTDGVADDYFPNDSEMLRLYGDLVINRIITTPFSNPDGLEDALKGLGYPSSDALTQKVQVDERPYRGMDGALSEARIKSFGSYVEALSMPLAQVAAAPALLYAACQGAPLCDADMPEERLRAWLDAYYVRGSFDDRTLVVLFPED